MRNKVLSMLAAYDADDTFLEKPAADVGPGAQRHSTTTHLVGTQVGPYEIKRSIARGGMGVVFEALDTKLDKVVALKMMSPALVQDPTFRQRFEQEAKTLARLEDPHFVRVNALIDDGPNTFIVMEYVDGVTLAQHIQKKGPLADKDAIAVGLQLLQALSKAHRQSIIHRDLKPSNIMLTKNYEGRLLVKVLDFGIAKNIQPDASQTRTVGAVGTLFYMSPEQARGLHTIDHRTDLYSLAVTLYEAVTGDLPFDTGVDEYTVRRQIVEGHVVPIDKRLPSVDRGLAAVLARALSTDPTERFENAETMRQALIGVLNEMRGTNPTMSAPAPPRAAAVPPKKRKPVGVFAGVSLVGLLAIVAFFVYSQLKATPPDPTPAATIVDHSDSLNTLPPQNIIAGENAPDSSQEVTSQPVLLAESEVPAGSVEEPASPPVASEIKNTAAGQSTESQPGEQEEQIASNTLSQEPLEEEETDLTSTPGSDSLEQLPENDPVQAPQETGTISVWIRPGGNVFVNGEQKLENDMVLTTALPVGRNTVRIENASLGHWACDMDIRANQQQDFVILLDNMQAIDVTAEDIDTGEILLNQAVYVDGQTTNATIPGRVQVPVGLRRLELKMDGYEQVDVKLQVGDRLEDAAGCFQNVDGLINVHPASVASGDKLPPLVILMRKQ